MGQESLEHLSISKYLDIWKAGLETEIEKQYLKDHFVIGEGGDENKIKFYQLYISQFCTDNCELSEWIWKKLNGFFEDPHHNKATGEIKPLRYQPVQNITNIYNNQTNWKETAW